MHEIRRRHLINNIRPEGYTLYNVVSEKAIPGKNFVAATIIVAAFRPPTPWWQEQVRFLLFNY